MGKVVVFLADGCEEIEALTVIDILRRGNVDVLGVSIKRMPLITSPPTCYLCMCCFWKMNQIAIRITSAVCKRANMVNIV